MGLESRGGLLKSPQSFRVFTNLSAHMLDFFLLTNGIRELQRAVDVNALKKWKGHESSSKLHTRERSGLYYKECYLVLRVIYSSQVWRFIPSHMLERSFRLRINGKQNNRHCAYSARIFPKAFERVFFWQRNIIGLELISWQRDQGVLETNMVS